MAVNQIFAGVKTGVGNLMSKITNFIRNDDDYEGSYREAVNPYQTYVNQNNYFAHQQAAAAPVVQNAQFTAASDEEETTGKVRRRFENMRGQVLQPDFKQHAQQVAAQAEKQAEAPAPVVQPEVSAQKKEPQHMYVVSASSMDDCYATISLLRQKHMVVFDMERLKPEEQKVQVDFMDGACCALGCTMTLVSQKGVYLLSPCDLVIHYNEGARNNNRGVPAGGYPRMGFNNANYQPRYNFRSNMNQPQGNAWTYTQQQPIQEYRGGYTEQLVQAPQAPVQNPVQPAMSGVAQNQY